MNNEMKKFKQKVVEFFTQRLIEYVENEERRKYNALKGDIETKEHTTKGISKDN